MSNIKQILQILENRSISDEAAYSLYFALPEEKQLTHNQFLLARLVALRPDPIPKDELYNNLCKISGRKKIQGRYARGFGG